MGFCARNPLPSEAQARVPTVCPWGNALAARETGRARPKAPAEMEAGVNALATFAQVKDGCVFSHAQCKRAYVAIRDRNKDPARRARQAGHGRTRRAAAAAPRRREARATTLRTQRRVARRGVSLRGGGERAASRLSRAAADPWRGGARDDHGGQARPLPPPRGCPRLGGARPARACDAWSVRPSATAPRDRALPLERIS